MTGNKREEIVDLRSDYVGQRRTLSFHELYLKGKDELSVFMRFDLRGWKLFVFIRFVLKGKEELSVCALK